MTNTYIAANRLSEIVPHFELQALRALAAQLPLETVVNVWDPLFMKELDRQLEQRGIEEWKLYLTWTLLRANARELSTPFRAEMFEFVDRYLGGQAEPEPRWKYCVRRTDALLGEALGKAYVDSVFPATAKARMEEMVKNIRAALDRSIRGLGWMTDGTKQKALAKLAALTLKVGYPERWRSDAGLRVTRGSHFDNVQAALRFNKRDEIGTIGKPTDKMRWRMTPPTSNVYASLVTLEIVFPAGILVPPMFDADASDAANYGAIGVVIGHEISHQFDDLAPSSTAPGV